MTGVVKLRLCSDGVYVSVSDGDSEGDESFVAGPYDSVTVARDGTVTTTRQVGSSLSKEPAA